jgi:predicted transcriptional regulator
MPVENEMNQDRHRTARVVAAYLRRNPLPTDQLGSLVSKVHEALGNLGKAPEPVAERTPPVPIRRSVQRDVVVCLDCGWRGHTLRRHLMTRHGISPDQYRARWNLRADHPLIAPEYSQRRSAMAKQLGFGRSRPPAEATESPEPDQTAARSRPRRQRRARSKSTKSRATVVGVQR